jgi:hypothetical protein
MAIIFIVVSACIKTCKNIGLKVECKGNEQFRPICRLWAALAYLIANKVEDVWPIIMENISQNEKLTLFINYYTQQLMENENILIEMWNINRHRHRTNSAVEGWNSKLNSTTGKQQPNVFLQIQK